MQDSQQARELADRYSALVKKAVGSGSSQRSAAAN
jgi:hypothetical protein